MDVHEAPEIVPFEEGLDIVDTIGQMGDIHSRESIDFARLARDESSPSDTHKAGLLTLPPTARS